MNIPRLKPIDTSVYQQMMNYKKKPYKNTIDRIRKYVTDVTGIDPYIDSGFRGSEFVKSRQLFMYFVRKHAKLSLYATGSLLGLDHSTVIYAVKCVEKYASVEVNYLKSFEEIQNKLKNYEDTL